MWQKNNSTAQLFWKLHQTIQERAIVPPKFCNVNLQVLFWKMRADCVCSKCLAKAFPCNGFASSVMQCFIWRDAWGSFRMHPECKNNRACHNKLSQENTNGNSLAVGCFAAAAEQNPLQSGRSSWGASDSRLLRAPLLAPTDTVNWRSFQSCVTEAFINRTVEINNCYRALQMGILQWGDQRATCKWNCWLQPELSAAVRKDPALKNLITCCSCMNWESFAYIQTAPRTWKDSRVYYNKEGNRKVTTTRHVSNATSPEKGFLSLPLCQSLQGSC